MNQKNITHYRPFLHLRRLTPGKHGRETAARRYRTSGGVLATIFIAGLSVGSAFAQSGWSGEWPETDFATASIDLGEIRSGGPPKDGIPALDRPEFVSHAEVDWLDPREPVIALNDAGQAKAYPLQILMWHEIVNDKLGELPVTVTFCPLCNAAIVFDRRVGDRILDFGTTGKLRKSDLVMYDRQTESWWQQFTGTAIVGQLTGTVLQRVPAQIIAYQDFRTAFPDGQVLSRETGYRRAYGRNPYRGYDRIDDQPFLFDDPVDPRLPAMERILNVSVAGRHRIYPFAVFDDIPVINDEVAGVPVVIMSRRGTLSALDKADIADSREIPSATAYHRRHGDRLLEFTLRDGVIVDTETESTWDLLGRAIDGPLSGESLDPADSGVHFAFAWLAFNPDSDIYGRPGQE
jgi:hypothetical protein